ncbi:MAG: hypothetical protein JWM76_2065 [Pseudonocardiales bacterium]|nr:hypothetical protein [Pseudonocardiales bacterium]
MSDEESADPRPASAVDAALGGLLSWVAGKESVTRGRGAVDGAVGELLAWFTGRGGKEDPPTRTIHNDHRQ